MQSLPHRVCCWLEKGWVGIPKPFHPFVAGRVFSPPWRIQPSHRPGEMGGWRGGGCVKVNVWFVGMGGGWVWRSVTWPTIGCCVILKVFLGEYNGPFRVHPVPRSSSLAPEVLHFVWRTAARLCLSSLAFWLAWHAWEGHEYWLFQTEPGMLSAGRIVYWGRGRTKSTKRARSQQWLRKCPETVFKGNKHLYSTSKPPWNITNSHRILISLVPPQSMAFVVKY